MRIGLFDSGIGGLTVLKTLKQKYPHNDYIYYGDTINLPYGTKTKAELLTLASKNIEFLIDKQVDMIIIACGTVSSNCLNKLKATYNIPIYSIVEPTIEYLNQSNYHHIGVIATPATINSHIFKHNINKVVIEIATPKLVPLIENNELNKIKEVLNEYLGDYSHKLDVLVLGCTHYPIIKDYLSDSIDIIDMSKLVKLDYNIGNGLIEIYFSKINDKIIENTSRILNDRKYIMKES